MWGRPCTWFESMYIAIAGPLHRATCTSLGTDWVTCGSVGQVWLQVAL